MIDLFLDLGVPRLNASSFRDVVARYPLVEFTKGGKRTNTLILTDGDKRYSLRTAYNKVENHLIEESFRYDYPSCAPHATGRWVDYETWLDSLSTFDEAQLTALKQRVLRFLLDSLPSHEIDPETVAKEPARFIYLLEKFNLTAQAGERTGAALQGIVFGFFRADNPHLQVEVDSVRTGARRRQRIGDIDAWDGERLAITAEVKQFHVTEKDVSDFGRFASEARRRKAIGLIAAVSFSDKARESIEKLGLQPLDLEQMKEIVSLWDPMKQRTAVYSFLYYVVHVERNHDLGERLKAFLQDIPVDST